MLFGLFIIYVIANIFFLFYFSNEFDKGAEFRVKHLILGILFLPASIFILLIILIFLSIIRGVDLIKNLKFMSKISKIWNKKLF